MSNDRDILERSAREPAPWDERSWEDPHPDVPPAERPADIALSETPAPRKARKKPPQESSEASETAEMPAPKKRRPTTIGAVLSGNILSRAEVRRAYPYMIFVVALMFFYIANAFRTQRIYREHAALTEQVKELRSKSMTIASQKMQATRQSNIMLELERRGIPLRESLTPNKVIPKDK